MNYQAHIKKHTNEKGKYICQSCNQDFTQKHLLKKKHINRGMCTVEKNFECTQCKPSKWFKTSDALVTHGEKYHSREIPLLDCLK